MKQLQPNVSALSSLSIEYGNRHFAVKLHSINKLEAELENWLFNDRRGAWKLFSQGLITERETRDLLLQRIDDYYRLTLLCARINELKEDPVENEAFDMVLFGRTARDAPPPPMC